MIILYRWSDRIGKGKYEFRKLEAEGSEKLHVCYDKVLGQGEIYDQVSLDWMTFDLHKPTSNTLKEIFLLQKLFVKIWTFFVSIPKDKI